MRVLWISGVCPLPLTDGHRQRVYHLLRAVAARHPTTLLCQVRAGDAPHVAELEGLCERVIAVPQPEGEGSRPLRRAARRLTGTLTRSPTCFLPAALPVMRQALSQLAGSGFDVAFGGLYCAPLVLAAPARRRVLDDQNVEGDLYRQLWRAEPPGPRRLSRRLDWMAVDAFERRKLPRADLVTVCSERDRQTLRERILTLPPALVVPNGVDLSLQNQVGDGGGPSAFNLQPSNPRPEVLVFTGSMAYAPNVEAAEFLVREIMPRVWDARPKVHLLLVGKDPHARVRALASARVTVTGAVPDTRPYLERAALAVAPLRSGGGTRLKVLEAMAVGVPVVSTSLGAEGLDLTPGRELAIADGAAPFAAAVLDLLASPARARTMALAARARVEATYGWEAIGAVLVEALEQCANPPTAAPGEVPHAPG